MKKIFRRIGIILMIPIVILFLLLILIYTPPIQNLLREKAVQYASEAAGFGISIDRIRLSFPLKLVAEGIQAVSDNDTLLVAERLDVHVKLLPLFRKQVEVNGITLKNSQLNTAHLIEGMVIKGSIGEVFITSHGIDLNLQEALLNRTEIKDTAIDLLLNDTTTTPKDTTSTPLKWLLTLEKLSLENVSFTMKMPENTLDLMAYVNTGQLRNGKVDLFQQLYRAERLEIEKSAFNYNSGGSPIAASGFDPSHISLKNINVILDSIHYKGKEIGADINSLSVIERSGLEITSARGNVTTNDTLIYVPELFLETPHSKIELRAKADWSLIQTRESGDLTAFINADIGKKDLVLFTGNLSSDFEKNYPFRPLVIRADIDGSFDDLEIKELRAELPGAFQLRASGQAEHLLDSLRRTANVELSARTENINFLLTLLPPAQRGRFTIPNGMTLNGTATLDASSISTDMVLQESSGRLLLKGIYDTLAQSYQALLNVDQLQLNHFMPRDSFYVLTADATINGNGFDVFSSTTRLEAKVNIDQFQYGSYNLANTHLEASLERTIANLVLTTQNAWLDLQATLNGLVNQNGIDAKLDMKVAKIDLYELNTIDKPLEFALNLNAAVASDLKENHTLSGRVGDMRIKTTDRNYYPKDIYLTVATTVDSIAAIVDAGDLHLVMEIEESIQGLISETSQFTAELTKEIENRFIYPDQLKALMPDAQVTMIAGTQNPLNDYLETRGINFRELSLNLNTSSSEGIQGNAHVYSFSQGTIQLDTIGVMIYQDTTTVKISAGVKSKPSQQSMAFSATLDGELKENTAQALLKYYNANENLGVELGAMAALEAEGISIHLIPEQPTLVFRPFRLNEDNYIFISNDNHIRANVSLLDDRGSGLVVYSLPSDTTVLQDMSIELRNIQLAEIRRVVPYMPEMSGTVSAEAHYVKTMDHLQVAADIYIDSLIYEGNQFENMVVEAVYLPGDADDHHIDAQLSYDNSEVLKVAGVYYTSGEGNLDANAVFEHFPLAIANPFIPDGIARMTGDMDGELTMVGSLNQPHVNGEVILDSVTVLLPQYGGEFHLEQRPIQVVESFIKFDNYNIYTTQTTNPFVINGNVNFVDISNITTDLTLRATDYELVNAERTSESLLYGRVVIDLDASVKGPVDALIVRGDITIQGSTNVTYVLTDASLEAQDRMGDMVTFVDFRDTTTYVTEQVPTVELGGMDMLMTIHIDEAAQLGADLTSDRSSYVQLEGGGDLSLQYTELDGLSLNGRYTLNSGRLKYTLIPFLAREFTITDGSYVDWTGNPMDPMLDITAVNHVRASVRNDGGGSRIVTFEAKLTIENRLEDLQLVFGMDAPEDMTIKNELAGMSEEELSKQAVAMMITGTYMGPSGSGNIGDNALNALLQQAVQGIAGSALKTIDITLDVETAGSQTDYSFTFAKRFWNDRISVIIGGKLSTGEVEESGRQTFIDNVSLEYRLDNTGSRYVRLFHDVNYDNILDGEVVETGGGIVLRKKMSRLKELFMFRRKKKEVKVETNDAVSSLY